MPRTPIKCALAMFALAAAGLGLMSAAYNPQAPAGPTGIPPYHDRAPEKELPSLLPATQFTGDAQHAYDAAGKVAQVLYQQPCYCYCNLDKGHTSLHDCFRTAHGSTCSICKREAIYAYE